MKTPKVAIIGAGPAGSFCSFLISKLNYDITIFEQKKQIKRKVCGEYLSPLGVHIIQKYQLDHILKPFEKVYGMILVDVKNNTLIKTAFQDATQKYYGYSLNREIFDNSLIKESLKCSNINLKLGNRISKIIKINNKWQLFFIENEIEYSELFDFVIVADGINSKIGKELNHTSESDYLKIALHCYLPRKKDTHLRYGEMHIFKDGSYCGLNPINENTVNFSIVLNKKIINNKKNILIEINNRIQESNRLYELFDLLDENVDIKSLTPLTHKNNHIIDDHLVYIGDSAGFIDPLTGEGITNALISASFLYENLKNNKEINQALKMYQESRQAYFKEKNFLNKMFQLVIKTPFLVSLVSKIIKKEKRGNIFINIIGNITTPKIGIMQIIKTFFTKE